MTTRAVVLGGGGVVGIAWEIGVLAGLSHAGADLRFDAVIGTSAGAFVGTALADGAPPQSLLDSQRGPAPAEATVTVPRRLLTAWIWAYLRGYRSPERIGAQFGRIAHRRTPLIDAEQRRLTVNARLRTQEWPDALRVTAIEARSGRLHAFTKSDGFALSDVLSASGAVPGISPAVHLGGADWIDGGMVSSTNARLAKGFDQVLVLAPLPRSHGGLPSARDEVERLSSRATAHLIVPNGDSRSAMGSNIYDPARRAEAADAGFRQGTDAAVRLPWAQQRR